MTLRIVRNTSFLYSQSSPTERIVCDVVSMVTRTSDTVELTGSEEKISGFLEVVEDFGVLEVARTGSVGMNRGKNL